MMLDWNAYQQQLVANIAQIGKISPAQSVVIASSATLAPRLESSTRRPANSLRWPSRSLDNVTAASPCTDAAAKHGATREEIAEALGVAIAVNAGAALVYSARVMDAYSAKAA
jgi:hypothetical protein